MLKTVTMIVGAAMILSACSGRGGSETTANMTDVTEVVDETPIANDSLANMMLQANDSAAAPDSQNAM
jgi:PBP1b-binding outer membrane lipoprotein LpoB